MNRGFASERFAVCSQMAQRAWQRRAKLEDLALFTYSRWQRHTNLEDLAFADRMQRSIKRSLGKCSLD